MFHVELDRDKYAPRIDRYIKLSMFNVELVKLSMCHVDIFRVKYVSH